MKLPYTICYTSVANNVSHQDVQDIFNKAYQFNYDSEICGMLLYSKEAQRFFQVLEGSKDVVIELYENKIRKDSRHKEIFEIYHRTTSKPIFFDYSTKFAIVRTENDLLKIKEYIERYKYSLSNSDKILRLLEPFTILYP